MQSLQLERCARSGPGEDEERFEKCMMRSNGHFERTRRDTAAGEVKFLFSLHAHLHLVSDVYMSRFAGSGYLQKNY